MSALWWKFRFFWVVFWASRITWTVMARLCWDAACEAYKVRQDETPEEAAEAELSAWADG